MREICICAAVKYDIGFIALGHRHHNCIDVIGETGRTYNRDCIQGFMTSKNRFVDRAKGYKLQKKAGITSNSPDGYSGKRLFSEDLY